MSKNICVKCVNCNNDFERSIGKYNEAVKYGWLFYCSNKCQSEYKSLTKKNNCSNCNKEINVRNSDYIKSKTKRFFCSKNCAAIFNNKLRGPKTEEIKKKISNGLFLFHRGEKF